MKGIFSIVNQKGGVGKTTTSLALGSGLIRMGKKVLFVDLDAQGNLTFCLGADNRHLTALDLLTHRAHADQVIQHTDQGDVIASSPNLAGMDTILTTTGREYRLSEALSPIREEYDYIIIDTPPSLGVLTINAMTFSTGVIIPAFADIFSLQGIDLLYGSIQAVRKSTNPDLKILGIVMTKHNPRTILSRDLTETMDETAKLIGTRRFKTAIRECISIKESQTLQRDIFSYAPRSNASKDYLTFTEEVLRRR
jgi:chromosome partitioning protein